MKYLNYLLILFLPFQLFGFDFKSITADYDVRYGVLGKVGKAHASIKLEGGTYKIRIEAKGAGLTKYLSRGREEVYESTGIIQNGKLVPTLFVKNRSWGSKIERKRYFFNHDTKSVVVVRTAIKGGKVSESREEMSFYAANDILSIFFNLHTMIGEEYAPVAKTELIAVGANRKNGLVSVEVPTGALKEEIRSLLEKEDHHLVVILNQKFFASAKGELYININDDRLCDRVILKDVMFYGDLRAKMKNLKIEK